MDNNISEEPTINVPSEESSNINGSTSCNPNLPTNLEPSEQEIIKGDAIGDTLYSERFVLKTMLNLAELTKEDSTIKWSDDMENDLCTLWDMTTEKDIVFFLLEHEFIELSLSVIKKSEEIRLTEIMVGIVGNMCCFHESCDKIFECEYEVYLSLINVTDTPLLIQLMRLFKSLLYKDAKHFDLIITADIITQVKFFLSSSQNSELLLYTLQTFELIIDKKKTSIISEQTLINMNEAFIQLFKNLSDTSGFLSHEHEKIITAYLKSLQNISLSLEELEDKDQVSELVASLEKVNDLTFKSFEKILLLLSDAETFLSVPENMEFYLFCIVQYINLLKSIYNPKILKLLLSIFNVIISEKIKFDEDILNDIVDIICRMVKIGENSELLKTFESFPKEKALHLLKENVVKRKTNNCDKSYLDKINELISL